MDLLMASGIFAVVFVFLVLALMARGTGAPEKRDLVSRMAAPHRPAEEITRAAPSRRHGPSVAAWLYRLNLLRSLEEQMWQAGIYMRVADMALIIVLLCGIGIVLGAVVFGDRMVSWGLGAGLALVPVVYIRIRRARRLRAFNRQLPYVLDLIKSSLEAGHSLLRGCQVIVAEFADPIGTEFRSVIEQTRLGLPLPAALEEMLKRVPEPDLRLLVVAVRVQSEVGSSLARIVGRLSELVRMRQRLEQQIRALTAQSRMSGVVVGVLPVVVLAAFSLIQPAYTHTLFHHPTGVKILKVAAILDGLALLTIRRLLRVKF